MTWGEASADELEQAFDHFFGLTSAGLGRVCELIREVDRRQAWMADGARTLADWVSARLSIRHETARALVRVARRLADLPELSSRFAAGDLSLDQVDAISRMATPENEHVLIEEALGLSNAALDRMARRANAPSNQGALDGWRRREAYLQWNLDRSQLDFRGVLPGAEGEMFQVGLEAAADRIPPNPETGLFDPYPTRLADGLVELVATTGESASTTPAQVSIHADLAALITETEGVSELGHGALVPNETARRLACDCAVETFVYSENVVVGVGRNSRTIPGWLRRLVFHRDASTCQFDGCHRTKWLEVHHIVHWSRGGKTDLDNLILLCGYHHRFVHEHGWHITGDPNERVTFRRPDWTPYPGPRARLDPRLSQLVDRGGST